MKKRAVAMGLCLSILASLFCGCSSVADEKTNESSTISDDNKGENKDNDKDKTNEENEQESLYDALFNIENSVSIKIDISNDELLKIEKDYENYSSKASKSPIYRRADCVTFTVSGKEYRVTDVGVRMKGNTSRSSFYDEQSGMYSLTHLKLSFSETFDNEEYYGTDAVKWNSKEERKERKNRTFATLEKMELKWNRNYDNTYCREYYAYSMFRDYGVLAPRMNMAPTTIGENQCGVFFMYEPVDKKFIERNLPEESGGDLYKAMWTNDPADYTSRVTYGIENEDRSEFYNYDLKTNKKTSQNEHMKNLISVLNKPNVTEEEFESVVDSDYWVKFAAVSYFTGNPDDMRNNYNNHYVYFLKSNGKAIFIPYDYDRTLGITNGWDPTGDGMTSSLPFSKMADGNGTQQKNPLYKYSISDSGYFVEQYKAVLDQIANSEWLTEENFKKVYDVVKANCEGFTVPDKEFDNTENDNFFFSMENGSGNMSVKQYFDAILKTYNKAIESIGNVKSAVNTVLSISQGKSKQKNS